MYALTFFSSRTHSEILFNQLMESHLESLYLSLSVKFNYILTKTKVLLHESVILSNIFCLFLIMENFDCCTNLIIYISFVNTYTCKNLMDASSISSARSSSFSQDIHASVSIKCKCILRSFSGDVVSVVSVVQKYQNLKKN